MTFQTIRLDTDHPEFPRIYLVHRDTVFPELEEYFSNLDKRARVEPAVMKANSARRKMAIPVAFSRWGVSIGGSIDPRVVFGTGGALVQRLAKLAVGRDHPNDLGYPLIASAMHGPSGGTTSDAIEGFAAEMRALGMLAVPPGTRAQMTRTSDRMAKFAQTWGRGWAKRHLGVEPLQVTYTAESGRGVATPPTDETKTYVWVPVYSTTGDAYGSLDCGWACLYFNRSDFAGVSNVVLSTSYPYTEAAKGGGHPLDVRILHVTGPKGVVDVITSGAARPVKEGDIPAWGEESHTVVKYTPEPGAKAPPIPGAAPIGAGWWDYYVPWGMPLTAESVVIKGAVVIPESDGSNARVISVTGASVSVVFTKDSLRASADDVAKGKASSGAEGKAPPHFFSTLQRDPVSLPANPLPATRFASYVTENGGTAADVDVPPLEEGSAVRKLGELSSSIAETKVAVAHVINPDFVKPEVGYVCREGGQYYHQTGVVATHLPTMDAVCDLVARGVPVVYEDGDPTLVISDEAMTKAMDKPGPETTGEITHELGPSGYYKYSDIGLDLAGVDASRLATYALVRAISRFDAIDKFVLSSVIAGQGVRREFEVFFHTPGRIASLTRRRVS